MEISEHPSSSHTEGLQQARQQAHELINSNTQWVIKNIPPLAPRYYKLALETTHAQCNTPHTTLQPEASSSNDADTDPSPSSVHTPTNSSTTTATSPSSATAETSSSSVSTEENLSPTPVEVDPSLSTLYTSTSIHPDDTEKGCEPLDYGGDLEEDTSMGPA